MTTRQNHNAQTSGEVVDRYFLEHRAKLIDLAAFLDRIDRAGDPHEKERDYRIAGLHRAINVLCDGKTDRAARVLSVFSDHTATLPESAEGVKGTTGAAKAEETA